jgi:hypothetical protein
MDFFLLKKNSKPNVHHVTKNWILNPSKKQNRITLVKKPGSEMNLFKRKNPSTLCKKLGKNFLVLNTCMILKMYFPIDKRGDGIL